MVAECSAMFVNQGGFTSLVSYSSFSPIATSVRCSSLPGLHHVTPRKFRTKLVNQFLASISSSRRFMNAQKPQSSYKMSPVNSALDVRGSSPKNPFQHLPDSAQKMMSDLLEILETGLGEVLLKDNTPENVQKFASPQGNGEGAISVRAGRDRNYLDRMITSTLHCTLPFGTLDFATVAVLMGPSSNAPHLLLEFPFSGPGKMTAVMDLLPRQDPVLHPEYLGRYYDNSSFKDFQKEWQGNPFIRPYIPNTLYIRAAISPVALLYSIDTSGGPSQEVNPDESVGGLDKIIGSVVHPTAKKIVAMWLEMVMDRDAPVAEGPERDILLKRDESLRLHGIEVDLTSNLPRLFGQDITDRILYSFRNPA